MRRINFAVIIALITFGVSFSAQAGTKFDLALWRFFLIQTPNGSVFSRGDLEFLGSSSAPFTIECASSNDNAATIAIKVKSTGEVYVWHDGNYVLCTNPQGNSCQVSDLDDTKTLKFLPDQDGFRTFVKAWAALWAPPVMSPAETLGHSGYDIGVETSFNFLTKYNDPAWASGFDGYDPIEDNYPPQMLPMVRLHFRKGLPYSTELGLNVGYLIGSQLFSAGLEFKVAIYEGFDNAPDIAAKFMYGHVFGTPQLNTDYFGGDVSMSYGFGAGGFVHITPYGGYSMLGFIATPTVQNVSFHSAVSGNSSLNCGNNQIDTTLDYNGPLIYLDAETVLLHRFFVGMRFIMAHFIFGFEYVFAASGSFEPENHTITLKLGGDF